MKWLVHTMNEMFDGGGKYSRNRKQSGCEAEIRISV